MSDFAEKCGYYHHHVTPEWPRANGMVEHFNHSMKESIQVGNLEGSSFQESAQSFIQMYWSTPHTTTGVSPHAAMHGGREMQTMLTTKEQKPHNLCASDVVIVKQTKINKLTPTFNPTRLRIRVVNGSRITAREIDRTWTITHDAKHLSI